MFIWQVSSKQFTDEEFIADYNKEAPKNLRIATVFALGFYNFFAVLDYFSRPEFFAKHTFIRLGVVTPILLFMIAAMRKVKNRQYARPIILAGSIITTLSVFYFELDKNPEMIARDPVGLVFVVMFCLTALRMLRREAHLYVASVMVIVIGLLLRAQASNAAWFSYLVAVGVSCGLGIGIAQIIENSWRRNFAQKKIIQQHEAQAVALLEMVFPVNIAERLKSQSGSIAEYSGDVSVLFADIEGFTSASQSLTPAALVADLDAIFSRLDELCVLCGCEKIKTIGDAYLAVSGVPLPASDHADRVVRLALAMQKDSVHLKLGGQSIRFRIGIHSGPVVAGVIGRSRFSYDLWGDTVNTASRMESTAPAGGIQISSETAKLISGRYILEPRGEIRAKGKGMLKTWIVQGAMKSDLNNEPQQYDKIA